MAIIKKRKCGSLIVDGVKYTPYNVSELPNSFGFKRHQDKDTKGYKEWFNYKGATYIKVH